MTPKEQMSAGDFQKLLQIALQNLTIQRTLLENQIAETARELRTLEREEELETLEGQLIQLKNDYQHYQTYLDPDFKLDINLYYQ